VDSLARLGLLSKKRNVSLLPTLCLLLVAVCTAKAELPPSAYEGMQSKAPEHLQIHVLRIDIQPAQPESTQDILLIVAVEKVFRTASDLKPGDVLNIVYSLEARPPGWLGPGQVPILRQGDKRIAYLRSLEMPETYAPDAGVMSFGNF
jgi:hypothetical protein